jgi:ketosteroid isomerase-like protein
MDDRDFELVRKAWAATSGRDITPALEFYSEDIEVVPFGAALQGRSYRGHDGVLDWWQNEIVPSWESFQVIPHEFQRVGDRLLVFGRWLARGRASGVELEIPATWIVEIRAGKIAGWQTFTERGEALDAVGLSEADVQPES